MALDNQALARLCSKLSHYALKMWELAWCLQGINIHTKDQCSDIESFRGPVQALLAQLDRLSMENVLKEGTGIPVLQLAIPDSSKNIPKPCTPPCIPRTYVLPPSPERQQIRKDSHSWHWQISTCVIVLYEENICCSHKHCWVWLVRQRVLGNQRQRSLRRRAGDSRRRSQVLMSIIT